MFTDRQVAELVLYRGVRTAVEMMVATGVTCRDAEKRVQGIHDRMRDEGLWLSDFDKPSVEDLSLRPGERIRITDSLGHVHEGKVLSAKNYGSVEEPDWYIELMEDSRGYEYWKQAYDGGSVEKEVQGVG